MAMVAFEKYEGSGNDFIMIDNRRGAVPGSEKVAFVKYYAPRALGIGADGVIFIEEDREADFRWDFFNADGSRAEACGNGSRCAAVFAHRLGIAGRTMRFRTLAGMVQAEICEAGARVQLTAATPPVEINGMEACGVKLDLFFLNTGVPHAVVPVADLEAVDVRGLGRILRHHARFAPSGTNVDFLQREGERIAIRTYERGVEDETLACGTGAVASAIVAARLWGMRCPLAVRTRSGVLLTIAFSDRGERIEQVFLAGPVTRVFAGTAEWPR